VLKDDLLPAPNEEYRLAHLLLGKKNDLDRRILIALVGRPRRFSELEPLLKGKAKNNLTTALHRLREQGLIDQRIEAKKQPATSRYELSELGILVVFRMNQMIPAHESAQAMRKGISASSA
jgi:DNA-binding HxlR family transcriptional regulator